MKLDALDHPKTLDFAARMSVELPTAIGYLELLWAFTGKKAPQGNIGKWPDGAISRACFWMGPPETFITALLDAGFLDADQEHRFTIHDWPEHAPRWVKSKLKSLGLSFVRDVSGDTAGDNAEDDDEDTGCDASGDTKGREGKGSEVQGSEAKGSEVHTDGLDADAWKTWVDYRGKIKKPLKPVSMPAAQQALAAFGSEQVAVVRQSIANGWQGLFPLKTNGAAGHAPPARRSKAFPT